MFGQGSLSGKRCIVRPSETNMGDEMREKRDDPDNRKGSEQRPVKLLWCQLKKKARRLRRK